jgi:hypothetical protein
MQNHPCTEVAYRIHFNLRGRSRHYDGCFGAQPGRRHGHSLRMVARRRGYNTTTELFRAQPTHLAIRAPQLEGEHGLQIFSFQPDLVPQSTRHHPGFMDWSFLSDIIDTCIENSFDIGMGHEVVYSRRGSLMDHHNGEGAVLQLELQRHCWFFVITQQG